MEPAQQRLSIAPRRGTSPKGAARAPDRPGGNCVSGWRFEGCLVAQDGVGDGQQFPGHGDNDELAGSAFGAFRFDEIGTEFASRVSPLT